MIVLDENITGEIIAPVIKSWYRGQVVTINSLRSSTVIKDDAIPTILRTTKKPTFITNNVSDFWRKLPAHKDYCIICFVLPNERIPEIPHLLRQILAMKEFKTKASRMGKVLQVKHERIDYYLAGENRVYSLPFPRA